MSPADFEERVLGIVEEGEEIVPLHVLLQEAVLWVVLLLLPLLFDRFVPLASDFLGFFG